MQSKITPATYVTISRFFLVPVFIVLFIKEKYEPAVIILGIASLTDFIDGFMARRFNMRSKLGSMLDPLADKFLMLLSFVALSILNQIPWGLTLLVIGRDLAIVTFIGVFIIFLKIKLFYKPTRFSKVTTFSQISVLTLSFLDVLFEKRPVVLSPLSESIFNQTQIIFYYAAIFLTTITVFQYGYIGYKFYRYGERIKPGSGDSHIF